VAQPTADSRIRSQLDRRGVAASEAQFAQLCAYIGLITKWNRKVNLTSLTLSPLSDEAIDRLLVEPLIAARALLDESASPDRGERPILVDVGSGGGSPAIPLKIAKPQFQLTMIESRARKSAFLRDAARQLALSGTEVITDRLEDFIQTENLGRRVENRPVPPCGKVAVVSVRAVRADESLWGAIGALLRPGGLVLWFRTGGGPNDPPQASALEVVESTLLIPERSSELVILRKPS